MNVPNYFGYFSKRNPPTLPAEAAKTPPKSLLHVFQVVFFWKEFYDSPHWILVPKHFGHYIFIPLYVKVAVLPFSQLERIRHSIAVPPAEDDPSSQGVFFFGVFFLGRIVGPLFFFLLILPAKL